MQRKKKNQNKKIDYIGSKENLKYISRCFYYGKLKDYEWVNEGLVLKFAVYTATVYSATTVMIRVYVPSDLEDQIIDNIECGSNYSLIAAPYKVSFAKKYPYRVDLLLDIRPDLF